MNATILHESKGRIRFRINQKQMTLRQADLLELWFQEKSWVQQVTVHERTCCVILHYCGSRERVIAAIRCFSWKEAADTVVLPAHSSRELNRCFTEKLVGKIILKAAYRLFFAISSADCTGYMADDTLSEKGTVLSDKRPA